MVAWGQASIFPEQDANQQLSPLSDSDAEASGRKQPASSIVSGTLAAFSDALLNLDSQTKHV